MLLGSFTIFPFAIYKGKTISTREFLVIYRQPRLSSVFGAAVVARQPGRMFEAGCFSSVTAARRSGCSLRYLGEAGKLIRSHSVLK